MKNKRKYIINKIQIYKVSLISKKIVKFMNNKCLNKWKLQKINIVLFKINILCSNNNIKNYKIHIKKIQNNKIIFFKIVKMN